jgi:putative ABC transport system permease protein
MTEMIMLHTQIVDEHFIDTYNMEIVRGRNFSKDFPSDPDQSIIINEATARKLGWQEDALGKEIDALMSMTEMKTYRVIGLIKDYHFLSLHEEIQPLVLYNASPYGGTYYRMSLRVSPENIQETIGFLRSTWREFDSQYPLEFVFLDDQYDALYRTEERLGQLFGIFTALAIIIGCLGLFGLSAYSAEQRTKEIGIRKVLGATTSNVTMLLVREFTKWVLLAVVIAWPVGYYIMHTWLQNFAYRIGLGAGIFLLSALLALVIAMITVAYQAVKAAVANPIESLKYE